MKECKPPVVARSSRRGLSEGWRATGILMRFTRVAAFLATLLFAMQLADTSPAGASSPADQGVTAKSINIGIPYVNFAALQSLGVTLNDGSFPDAYNALIANLNAHGGVDGRKLVPYYVEMNPAVPSQATSSCAQLTEDNKVFVAISPVFPDCYQQDHDTPVIAGSLPGTLPKGVAPDFTLVTPASAYDPLQFAMFKKLGVFKNKKVGLYVGETSDEPELKIVQSALKKLHVNVVLSAINSTPETDPVASDQEVQSIALRFQSAGVNEVIGVGGAGSTSWPIALLANQSSYKPPWIATNESSLLSYVQSAKGNNPYLDNVMASTPIPSFYQWWQDPAIRKCASIVHKAYPSDTITPPANPSSPEAVKTSTDTTYASVAEACQYLAMFAKIADAAGKNLTVATFSHAGFGLRNVSFPGSGGPVSFGPNQPYAVGPVNVVVYNRTSKTLVPASTAATR